MLTVNARSNDLTFFPDFGPGISISTDGIDPVAALAGDFNDDGISELIVANGDGRFALLQGSENDMFVSKVLSTGLSNVSDLALGGVSGDVVGMYAMVVGQAEAVPLSFDVESRRHLVCASWTQRPVEQPARRSPVEQTPRRLQVERRA